ncbi:MAG: hypothetical protein KF785_11035 [Gemmatimonadales bacterium]|nr:hypothetical protein [Gemmatimonadales bacterium]
MEVQVFGTRKSSETRAALRFFAERRVKTHFVDFAVRAPARGELLRFVQKFGLAQLIDRSSKRFAELGWSAARYSDDQWLDKLSMEPGVIRQPLVRYRQQLTIGPADATWKTWE